MKVTPQITADFEDYPELAPLIDQAIRRVVELMEIHDISEIRRVHKTGVFDRPYTKDLVTPIGVSTLPNTVSAVRYAAGKALLDYLETIGISGIGINMTPEEVANVSTLWTQGGATQQPIPGQTSLDPEPAPDASVPEKQQGAPKQEQEEKENTASEQPKAAKPAPAKEKEN